MTERFSRKIDGQRAKAVDYERKMLLRGFLPEKFPAPPPLRGRKNCRERLSRAYRRWVGKCHDGQDFSANNLFSRVKTSR